MSAGKNIVLDQAGKQFTYSLNKDVDLTKDGSLTIGDTKINNGGMTITGGPSVTKTGIDAGNKNITNVKAGVNDTDAVNVSQIKGLRTEVKGGNGVTVAKTQDATDGHDIYTFGPDKGDADTFGYDTDTYPNLLSIVGYQSPCRIPGDTEQGEQR